MSVHYNFLRKRGTDTFGIYLISNPVFFGSLNPNFKSSHLDKRPNAGE